MLKFPFSFLMRNAAIRIFLFIAVVTLIVLFLFTGSKSTDLFPVLFAREKTVTSSTSQELSEISPIQPNDDGYIFTFPNESPLIRLYLDVVRETVCGLSLRTQEKSIRGGTNPKEYPFNLGQRIGGFDWPLIGITMIGRKRLINVEWAIRRVIAKQIPGDFIECGVWRGGGSIFARAVFKAFNVTDRHVWLADSFQGLPKPRTKNDNFIWERKHYLRVIILCFLLTAIQLRK